MTDFAPGLLPTILRQLKGIRADLEAVHGWSWEINHDLYDRLHSVVEDVDSAAIKLDQILKGGER